jgi:hypothetical protein
VDPCRSEGLGLHLQTLAQSLPAGTLDLHEPHRTLASLDPYDHLRRLTRLCYVHVKRNIHECKVSPDVRALMGSLLCITHPNWDQTIEKIKTMGGKAATSESSIIL